MTANIGRQIAYNLSIDELLKEDEIALLRLDEENLFAPNFKTIDKFLADFGFNEAMYIAHGIKSLDDEAEPSSYELFYINYHGDLLSLLTQFGIITVKLDNLILSQSGLLVSRKAKVYVSENGWWEEEVDLYECAMLHPKNIKQEYFSRTISELIKKEKRNSMIYR